MIPEILSQIDLPVLTAVSVLAASFILSVFRLCASLVRRKP